MKIIGTEIEGAFLIIPELIEDERGFFARLFCQNDFQKNKLNFDVCQTNISYNKKKGTLRGMHYQKNPKAEDKIVRCTKGSIYDVIIDLRSASSSYCKWLSFILSEDNHKQLFIPKGIAHGFQSLEPNSEVFYLMSEFYSPEHATGVRYDDPSFKIKWPIQKKFVSDKDKTFEDFK